MSFSFSNRVRVHALLLTLFCISWPCRSMAADAKKNESKQKVMKITYDEHIKPIFRNKCFGCHNADRKKGDLDLTNFSAMMAGGGSGTVVEAGASADSYLYDLVTHNSEPAMPPESEKLAAASLDLIKKWIDQGALENSSSKVKVNKPTQSFTLKSASSGRPAGAPPMPQRMSLEPFVVAKSTTSITALATSPWAPLVAVAGQKQVLLYNSKTLAHLGSLSFPEGTPYVLKFSRNGSLLLAGGGRGASVGKVAVWDIKTGKRLFTVGDELDCVMAADISSDQSLIALGGPHRKVRVYSTSDGSLQYEIKKHTDWVTALEFSPDSVLLATGDRSNGLFIWEAQNGREYLNLTGHRGPIVDVSWRSDSNIVASADDNSGDIKLWEMENGKQIKSWRGHGGGVADIEFCRDGKVVSCGRDRLTRIWDQNGKSLRSFPAFSDLALRVTCCDESSRVIAGDWTGKIAVWEGKDGKPVGELAANPQKLSTRLSTAQQLVVSREAELKKALLNQTNTQTALNNMNNLVSKTKTLQSTSKTQISTAEKTEKQTKTLIAKTKSEYSQAQQLKNKTATQIKQITQQMTAQTKAASAATAAVQSAMATLSQLQKAHETAIKKAATDKQAATQAETTAKASEASASANKATKETKAKAAADRAIAKKQQELASKSTQAVATAKAAVSAAEKVLSQKSAQQKTDAAKLTTLKKSLSDTTKALTTTNNNLNALSQKLKSAQQQLTAAGQLKKTAQANNKKSTDDLKKLSKSIQPYVVNYNKAKQAATVAQQNLTNAQAAVKTWQDEIAFAASQKK